LLPRSRSFLALDLPGHGLSSRIPDGLAYHTEDNLFILKFLTRQMNWSKISLLGHSMGAVLSFAFATVFPSKTDLLIQIDAIKPEVHSPKKFAKHLELMMLKFMLADLRNKTKSEPPSYTHNKMIQMIHRATLGDVTKENAQFLLNRNMAESKTSPGKFFFSRDSRIKHSLPPTFNHQVSCELAKRLKIPHMFIKASKAPHGDQRECFEEVFEILKKNPKFESHVVESSHYVHLNEPEKIAQLIKTFLEKHERSEGLLSKIIDFGKQKIG
jgi:pimeloyl-ACP methyl ester carboxylesterase